MATNIIVPHLGESVETAVLAAWLRQIGEPVKRGDEIAEIETDKAVMPLECPANGVLLAVLVEAGAAVRIGQLLAVIGQAGETWPPEGESPSTETPLSESGAPVESALSGSDTAPTIETERRKISPLARRIARELGIDLNQVQPLRGDAISSEDVERYAAERAGDESGPAPSRRVPLSTVKKIAGRRMLESAQAVPQFSVSLSANVERLEAFRAEQAAQGRKFSVTALLVYLMAAALPEHPLVNAQFNGDDLIVYEVCNIGVAVAADDGLRVPVLHRVERLTLTQISERLAALADKARGNRLSPEEVAHTTFTISNLGMTGVTQFVPLINPPQAAILGVGAAHTSLILDERGVRPIPVISLTLTADHRVLDGAEAAAFLTTLKAGIETCRIDRIA